MNRTRKLSSPDILERAKRAEKFLELSNLNSESDDSASRATSVSNAVLAAIAAADVICSVEINRHSQTENHKEAIRHLKEAIPEKRSVINAFSRLLNVKADSHYGAGFTRQQEAQQQFKNATIVVEQMREQLSKFNATDTPSASE